MALQNLVRFHRPLLDTTTENLPTTRGWNDLHREMDRIFDSFFGDVFTRNSTGLSPLNLDIAETDTAYLITAELPGLDQSDIDLTVADGILTLKGEKRQEEESGNKTFHRTERSYGSFKRVLQLPSDADEQAVNATMKNGLLKVEISKNEQAEPTSRKIDIKTA
ncbi:MAG: Hsp20/alpha crystallin family protein [Micavibrio sp.]